MAVYLVGYDLHQPGQKYAELWAALESYEAWWHELDSTYLIVTSQTAFEVATRLEQLVDDDDKVLVIRVGRESSWTESFSADSTQWLKDHL